MKHLLPTGTRRTVVTATAVASVLAMSAASASAQDPTGAYADFKHCPLDDATVTSCLYSETNSGTFQLGNAEVPINKTITLQGGYKSDGAGGNTFVGAVGADTLSKTPLNVPGGLLGITVPEQIRAIPILGGLFDAAVNAANGVTATAELAGPVGFNFINVITANGPGVTLPVRIKLSNPFLGSNCYIGSASNPVRLSLTTGTTSPPAPNTPATGSIGAIEIADGGNIITGVGTTLVDNAFSVPSAQDCGPFGFRWAVTPIVNLKEGFPSAAGTNSASLTGDVKTGSAAKARASRQ